MSLNVQLYTILAMVGGGIWIGVALDTYQRFQTRNKRWNWLRFINDIIFWVLQALFIFYLLLQVNQGEVRVIIFLALLCGFACYQSLLQSGYKKLLEKIISVVIWIATLIKKLFWTFFIHPSKVLLNLLLTLSKMVGRLLITILLFLSAILLFPFKVFGIISLLEKIRIKMLTKLKGKAGIVQKPTNKVKEWIAKFRR